MPIIRFFGKSPSIKSGKLRANTCTYAELLCLAKCSLHYKMQVLAFIFRQFRFPLFTHASLYFLKPPPTVTMLSKSFALFATLAAFAPVFAVPMSHGAVARKSSPSQCFFLSITLRP